MQRELEQNFDRSLLDDQSTFKKISVNLRRCHEMDQTANMDEAANRFRLEDCNDEYWGPENFSLMYGTPLWDQATISQKVKLNQLYWVAYYSQIISAEIATIFFNQTAAAGLYSYEDFRVVCDTLDAESAQERAHIAAFKRVSEEFEWKVFGKRLFTYPMRSPFVKTMAFSDLNAIEEFWRTIQLKFYSVLSSQNAFIGCQYCTVRGIRTLNGKIVQHKLSQYYIKHPQRESVNIPAKISYYHFLDESFHFNTSTCISHDVVNSLREPTRFERLVANQTLRGCQRDHFNFSTAINGIFWYDPDMMPTIFEVLRSKVFGMDEDEAKAMMWKCFGQETSGASESHLTHLSAIDSYKNYLSDFRFVNKENHEMKIMSQNSMKRHLRVNREALRRLYGPEMKIGHA
jgi:hypothetical protein